MAEKFNIIVQKIVIHTLIEGIFHSSFYCKDKKGNEIEIDARTSDSIALAIRCSCPIFTHENILKNAGIIITTSKPSSQKEKEERKKKGSKKTKKEELKDYNIQKLNKLLKIAIEKENYEYASVLRDEIKKRKKK